MHLHHNHLRANPTFKKSVATVFEENIKKLLVNVIKISFVNIKGQNLIFKNFGSGHSRNRGQRRIHYQVFTIAITNLIKILTKLDTIMKQLRILPSWLGLATFLCLFLAKTLDILPHVPPLPLLWLFLRISISGGLLSCSTDLY